MKQIGLGLGLGFLVIVLAVRPSSGSEALVDTIARITQGASGPFSDALQAFGEGQRKKIVGGQFAVQGQFPWQVSLGVSWIADPFYAHFCGGSIIDPSWILTAAHCVDGENAQSIVVSAGAASLSQGAVRRNVRLVVVHRDYSDASNGADIALLQLFNPLPVGESIKPIPLMSPEDEARHLAAESVVTVLGWGATSEGGESSLKLKYLEVPLVSRERCNYPVSYDGDVGEDMICAGVAAGGRDSCQGDSGGPLSVDQRQVGVVSWGEGCARPNKFGVYTRVTAYSEWVDACRAGTDACTKK